MRFTLIACCVHAFLLQPHTNLVIKQENNPRTYLIQTLSNSYLRTEFASFIDTVLRQISSTHFYKFIDEIQKIYPSIDNDLVLYEHILTTLPSIQPRFSFIQKLKALHAQKQELTSQIQSIIGNKNTFRNVLEIGAPGTYISCLQKYVNITGKIYVINEKQAHTDRFQAFSYNPFKKFSAYDHFVLLCDYEPISEQAIPSNSIDLALCFIGLHHIPQEKLDNFVASIARIMRPGGIFILRDHDTTNSNLMAITHAAHTVFNALMTQETVKTEQNEYRNFQPLDYWINLLEKHGFITSHERILQKGDPTRNTLIKFIKQAQTQDEQLQELSDSLKTESSYMRDPVQGDLSAPEWLNVDCAQEYASYINHTPFYEFPYMKSVATYWNVFKKSFHLAAQKQGALKTIISPYTLMNLLLALL